MEDSYKSFSAQRNHYFCGIAMQRYAVYISTSITTFG